MTLTKIDETKLLSYSRSRLIVGLPRVFVNDNNLKRADNIIFYRTLIDGNDALVIVPKNQAAIKKEVVWNQNI